MQRNIFLFCLSLLVLLVSSCTSDEDNSLKLISFSPASGIAGDTVEITGQNFSGEKSSNRVFFNQSEALIISAASNMIKAKVPNGAASGKIAVSANGETSESATDFIVLVPPSISGFVPVIASAGATVTITGANFNVLPANNTVKFGDIISQVTFASETELKVIVPANAVTSKISISVNGIVAISSTDFKRIIVTVSTIAGSGTPGNADGQGSGAQFSNPAGLFIDGQDNIYLGDKENHRIRKVTSSGAVSTIAGSDYGYAEGEALQAKFNKPEGIVMDGMANLYIADGFNNRIRKISFGGIVSTIAGDGTQDYQDGNSTEAKLFNPTDVVSDANGDLYVADFANHSIRKISSTGEVTTLAGNPEEGNIDGVGTQAKFSYPRGLYLDNQGSLYVADYGNSAIRKVNSQGEVVTIAGTGTEGKKDGNVSEALFNHPSGIALDEQSNIYVTDFLNHSIRMITPDGDVVTLAGNEQGYLDGNGTEAKFFNPIDLVIDSEGVIYVADYNNHRIRKITIEYK